MRIGIDACCWSNRRGFGRFTRELVTQIARVCAEDRGHEVTLVLDRSTAESAALPVGVKVEVVDTLRQPTRAAAAADARSPGDLWRMRRGAIRCRPEVFFFPAVYTFFPIPGRIPTVVTFHDAIAENHPELVFPRWRSRWMWNLKTRLALSQADRVLTVSEAAKNQIVETFGLPPTQVGVTLEGPSPTFRPHEDSAAARVVRDRYDLPPSEPLILYVGGISPHKNLPTLLRAAARLDRSRGDAWTVVLVGDYASDDFLGCYEELVALRDELGIGSRIRFTGFVSDDDLVTLYNTAALLVLPSFSEGFGLPVVEAMACGLPVVVSAVGSLPEVAGDAALSFDPHDVAALEEALGRLLDDDDLASTLARRGLERARKFSWEESARSVVGLLEEVARGR